MVMIIMGIIKMVIMQMTMIVLMIPEDKDVIVGILKIKLEDVKKTQESVIVIV